MTEKLKAVVIGGRKVWVDVGDTLLLADASVITSVSATSESDRQLKRTSTRGQPLQGAAQELAEMDLAPTLEAVLEPVKTALAHSAGLKEVTVEVVLGIKGEVGFFIAKGEANGSIKVTAKWAPEPAEPRK